MSKASDAKLEADFQGNFIRRLRKEYEPRIIVLKNDSGYQQGIPDLTVILPQALIVIEVKPYFGAPYEPNQEYFLDLVQQFGFYSATLFPENEQEVWNAIQETQRAF